MGSLRLLASDKVERDTLSIPRWYHFDCCDCQTASMSRKLKDKLTRAQNIVEQHGTFIGGPQWDVFKNEVLLISGIVKNISKGASK